MNKLFNKIAAGVVGLAMAVGVGVAIGSQSKAEARSVKAAEQSLTPGSGQILYTHDFSAKPTASADNTLSDTKTTSQSSVVWTGGSATNLNSYNSANYKGVQLGAKGKTGSFSFVTKYDWGSQTGTYSGYTVIKKIALYLNNGNGTISATVKVGGTNCTSSGTVSKNTSAVSQRDGTSKVEYTPASGHDTGKINIAYSATSGGGYFCSIQVLCEQPAGTPTVTDVTVTGDMTTKSYTTIQSWDHTGLTANVTMSSGSYSDTPTWSYSPTSPAIYVKNNGSEVTSGSITATATAGNVSGSKTVTGISVSYATPDQALAAIPNVNDQIDDVIVKGVISQIDSIDTGTYGNATYYISFDGTTTNQLEIYRGYGLNNAHFTNSNDLKVNDEVVVYGTLKNYSGTKEFTSGSYLLSFNRPQSSDPSITITDTSFRMYVGDSDVDLSETHVNVPTGGSINWVSGTQAVATINASTGAVHAVAAGTSTISAQILDSGNNVVASNSITVTVVSSVVSVGDIIYLHVTYSSTTYYLCALGGTSSSTTTEADKLLLTVEAGVNAKTYALKNESNYLKCTTSTPYLGSGSEVDSTTSWEIYFDGTNNVIASVSTPDRFVMWNYNVSQETGLPSPRFGAYKNASETILHVDITKSQAPQPDPSIDYSSKCYGGVGTLVTSLSGLKAGDKIAITDVDDTALAGTSFVQNTIRLSEASFSITNSQLIIGDGSAEVDALILKVDTFNSSTGDLTLKLGDQWLTSTAAKKASLSDTAFTWNLSFVSSIPVLESSVTDGGTMQYNYNNGTNPRFIPYTSEQTDIHIWNVLEYTDEAETYAANFLSSGLCGANDNTKASSTIWGQQRTAYLALSNGAQNLLSHAVALESSTDDIQKCLARYDRVIYLHYTAEASAYPDFMNRVANNYVTPKASRISFFNGGDIETNNALAIVLASILGLTTIGGYFVIRKRKFTK